MILLSRRALLAIAAVVDIALHARPAPVAAKALAARHRLPPRHLETLLQALVRANVLKGVRGPRGGYELARERRRISIGEIVRVAIMAEQTEAPDEEPNSKLISDVVAPVVSEAGQGFITTLDGTTVEDLCRQAEQATVFGASASAMDFTI
ncbi:MAG: Rrf2 family transcriptional regulator [Hyphomicrobiales bacterium]|nr:Rrf2 family transcriptional regulator [Hyphomicrobiales bacterium]